MTDRGHRVTAILIAVAELLLAPLALFFAAMSVMMFDAPGSSEKPELWMAFWSACAVPVALVVGAGFAIAAARRYTRRRLLLSVAIPGAAILWSIVSLAMLG